MTELHWTEVDGVATVWAEAPAPFRAALLFRTGRADETLATSGQTHLIEHMAMSGVGDPARDFGFVGDAFSGFLTAGSPEEVSTFLLRICISLGSMPGERLAAEKHVLEAEDATRRYDVRARLLTGRFGAANYGLVGLPELGLRGATLEQLDHLRLQRFTSGNAVLWLSGQPPAGLRLDLPLGKKLPLPAVAPVRRVFPSWYVDDMCGGVAAGATVPRFPASTVFCKIAARRMRTVLRVEKAVSYAPAFSYDPLDGETAHLVLFADSAPSRRAELADAFGEVVDGLREFDEPDIAAAQKEALEELVGSLAPAQDQRVLFEVARAAVDRIFGREFVPVEVIQAQILSVTPGDVEAFGRDARGTLILALPGESPVRPWFGERLPVSTASLVEGRRIPSMDAPVRTEHLVHGPDGVSVLWPDGSHLTVRYSELEAAVSYEDGGLHLVGRDATTVAVEPTLWPDGYNVARWIRDHIPAHLLLDHGSRPPSAIPRPSTNAWQRMRSGYHRSQASRSFLWFALGVLIFLLAVLAFLVLIFPPV